MADLQSRACQYTTRLNAFEPAAFWSFTFTSPFRSGPDGPLSIEYERHQPEKTLLHEVVREQLEPFLARARRDGASRGERECVGERPIEARNDNALPERVASMRPVASRLRHPESPACRDARLPDGEKQRRGQLRDRSPCDPHIVEPTEAAIQSQS